SDLRRTGRAGLRLCLDAGDLLRRRGAEGLAPASFDRPQPHGPRGRSERSRLIWATASATIASTGSEARSPYRNAAPVAVTAQACGWAPYSSRPSRRSAMGERSWLNVGSAPLA